MDIKEQAHKYLIDKGCLSVGQTYTAFQVERMLAEFAQEQVKLFCQPDVSGRSEQLVCDYCGKDKVEGLDHCKCYNGTAWVKKAN